MSWAKTAKPGDRIVALKTGKFLVEGKVYVVEDILPPVGKDFGVLVLGLRGNRKGKHKSGAFQAYCFRPLEVRPTDITVFTKLLSFEPA